MQEIAVEFTYHTDIICVPDDVAKQIKKYQSAFDKWIYDKNHDHGHWIVQNGKKFAVSFDTGTFVDYLNSQHLKNRTEKAFVQQENIPSIPSGIPSLCF